MWLKTYKTPLILCLAFFIIYNINLAPKNRADSIPTALIPFSILCDGNLYLDKYTQFMNMEDKKAIYFITQSRGHWISSFPVVTSILITPFYIPAALYIHFSGTTYPSKKVLAIGQVMEKFSASVIATLSCLFMYLIFLQIGSKRMAIISTLIYGLATNTYMISSQALWQQGPVELLLAISIYAFLKAKDNQKFLLLGVIASGLLPLARNTAAIFTALFFAYIFFHHRKSIIWAMLIYLCCFAIMFIYNYYYFSNILGGYEKAWRIHGDIVDSSQAWRTNILTGLTGLFISPGRGLFIFTPVTIFAFIYIIFFMWRDKTNALFIYLTIGAILLVLVYSKNYAWFGGACYGPRYLTDILPVLCIFIALMLQKIIQNKPVLIIFCLLAGFSFFVQIVGAFLYSREVQMLPSKYGEWETVWHWEESPFIQSLKYGHFDLSHLKKIRD